MRAPSFLASLIAGAVLSFSGIAHAQSGWDPRPYENQLTQWRISLMEIHTDLLKWLTPLAEHLNDRRAGNESAPPMFLGLQGLALSGIAARAREFTIEINSFTSKVVDECPLLTQQGLFLESGRCLVIAKRSGLLTSAAISLMFAALHGSRAVNSLNDSDLEKAELLYTIADMYGHLSNIYFELEDQKAKGQ
ncbi:hypothetical protein [Thermus thermophilus]|uniref:hypothetical protein n=1 Tax=Thermus thermophilus TaxID=274 RepID=UPI00126986B3|nr:hypothetical protein [Thermus thermophilus]